MHIFDITSKEQLEKFYYNNRKFFVEDNPDPKLEDFIELVDFPKQYPCKMVMEIVPYNGCCNDEYVIIDFIYDEKNDGINDFIIQDHIFDYQKCLM